MEGFKVSQPGTGASRLTNVEGLKEPDYESLVHVLGKGGYIMSDLIEAALQGPAA